MMRLAGDVCATSRGAPADDPRDDLQDVARAKSDPAAFAALYERYA